MSYWHSHRGPHQTPTPRMGTPAVINSLHNSLIVTSKRRVRTRSSINRTRSSESPVRCVGGGLWWGSLGPLSRALGTQLCTEYAT